MILPRGKECADNIRHVTLGHIIYAMIKSHDFLQ